MQSKLTHALVVLLLITVVEVVVAHFRIDRLTSRVQLLEQQLALRTGEPR